MSEPDYYPEDPYQQQQLQTAASAPPPDTPLPAPRPVASFTYSPPDPGQGQSVLFDATGSLAGDADTPITDYAWLFNGTDQADGVTATWMTPAEVGDYPVQLTVTAADSQADTTTQTITVP